MMDAVADRTCKTCRYWGSDGDTPDVHLLNIGDELHDVHQVQRHCGCPKMIHPQSLSTDEERRAAVTTDDVVLTNDGSGYCAYIETGPDFGCIHHETGAS